MHAPSMIRTKKLQSLYHAMSAQQALSSWHKTFLGILTVVQLVENYSAFKEPKCTLLHSQKPANEPHLSQINSIHILNL
jgi:hypothetical protein